MDHMQYLAKDGVALAEKSPCLLRVGGQLQLPQLLRETLQKHEFVRAIQLWLEASDRRALLLFAL